MRRSICTHFPTLPKIVRHTPNFVIRENDLWKSKVLMLPLNVKVQQETDINKACEIGVGAVLWNSGIAISCFIAEKLAPHVFTHMTVLDVGSGTGAVGCVCAAHSAPYVYLTDTHAVLQLLQHTVSLNQDLKDKVIVKELNWHTVTTQSLKSDFASKLRPHKPVECVICSDTFYIEPPIEDARNPFKGIRRFFETYVESCIEVSSNGCIIVVLDERSCSITDVVEDVLLPMCSAYKTTRLYRVTTPPYFTHTKCHMFVLETHNTDTTHTLIEGMDSIDDIYEIVTTGMGE